MKVPSKRVRCAIYTRKSTDEGLDQDFNSLDAQREAAEAYIASQKHEGWECLPDRYDDGGYSGGNIDRPAFQQLMADLQTGKVDCIMVYKIDRLSRSLMDFARIMETLERCGVSLVSVTQQFNTTTSMGRLTLNILLSFAQFEREIISERTRDKMTAARRKGKWTGGRPVLGYDVDPKGGRLLVNKAEAIQVRDIFRTYLDEGSLQRTAEILRQRGWTTKHFKTRKGTWSGGTPFSKPTLRLMLNNVIYTGKVRTKGEVFAGEHKAIIEDELFEAVHVTLRRNHAANENCIHRRHAALLKGLMRCKHCGCGMTHHFTTRSNRRYRYYVCINAQRNGWSQCPAPSLPARELEEFVVDQIRSMGSDKALLEEILQNAESQLQAELEQLESQRKQANRKLRSIGREIGVLGPRAGLHEGATRELGHLQELLHDQQQEVRRLDEQLAAIRERMVESGELAGAAESFGPLWDSLPLAEQAALVNLLIDRIEYDADTESISISYHPTGIRTLVGQHEENAICQTA